MNIGVDLDFLGVDRRLKPRKDSQSTTVFRRAAEGDARSVPSSGSDLLDSGSAGLCPLASWMESHGAGVSTLSLLP